MTDALTYDPNAETIDLGAISEIGVQIPLGRYRAKLSAVNPKTTKTEPPKPMVEAIFDIVEGEQQGLTANCYYVISVTKRESVINGKSTTKLYAPGIMDFKAACAAVGQPVPNENFPLDATRAAKLYGTKLHPQHGHVELAVFEERRKKKNDDGKWVDDLDDAGKPKMTTRVKVVGLWKATSQSGAIALGSAAAVDPLKGLGV